MTDRYKNGALAGLLVLTLVLVGFSLRGRGTEQASPSKSGVATPTVTGNAPSSTPSAKAGPVVFVGDSMAEGKSASAPAKRWTALVAADLGQPEVNLGHARTGYLKVGPDGSCGDAACPNFQNTVGEIAKAEPSTVIISGGGNDAQAPAKEFAAAVAATLTAVKKAVPEATIYVINPWWDLRPVPETLAEQSAAIKAAADAADVVYLDTKQPLVDKPALMVASGSNPNDAGHAALAKAVSVAIARSG